MACLGAAALAFCTYSPYLSLSADPSGSRTSAGPSSSALPSTPSTPAFPPTTHASQGDLPPVPGGQQPGIRLVATVLAKGVIQLSETVRLAAPVTTLTLAPPDLRSAGGDLRSARPVATELVVRADGKRVQLPRRTVRRATTLVSRQSDDLPVAVTVRGEAVRNLGCVQLPVGQQACFAGRRPNARANRTLPLRAALVQVQLDLQPAARESRR